MFGVTPFELMVVGVVAVLLFGSKLPEVARSLGGSYREFRKGLTEFQNQMRAVDFNAPASTPSKAKPKYDEEDEEQLEETTAARFIPPPRKPDNDA
jgi:sec-independent protein translocase protein TatA